MSLSAPATAAQIRWTGDLSCQRQVEVAEQVAAMTGRDVSAIDSADFELVTQPLSDGTWRLELKTLRRADGTLSSRSLQGKTCVEVTDAAAVAIALAVGPQPEPVEPKMPTKLALTPAAPGANSATVSARPEADRQANSASLLWFAGSSGALDSSVTPQVALGGAVRFGLSWFPSRARQTRLRLELEGALYAPTETASSQGEGGKFQLGYLAPLVCAERPAAGNALLACVGYEIGRLSGEGSGAAVTTSRHRDTLWSAARAELGLLVPIVSGVRAFGRGGAALPFVRHDFVVDGSDVVFRPSALSFRGQLGLELSL